METTGRISCYLMDCVPDTIYSAENAGGYLAAKAHQYHLCPSRRDCSGPTNLWKKQVLVHAVNREKKQGQTHCGVLTHFIFGSLTAVSFALVLRWCRAELEFSANRQQVSFNLLLTHGIRYHASSEKFFTYLNRRYEVGDVEAYKLFYFEERGLGIREVPYSL